jgi:hypothetical protein
MNFAKLFQGIIAGALFSGILSAIYACYIAHTSNTVSDFGLTAEDFWWLAMLLGGLFGLFIGGIIGGIISELHLDVIKGGFCGFLITAIPACFLLLLSEGKFDENITRFGVAYIFIATITGMVVPLTQMLLFKNE